MSARPSDLDALIDLIDSTRGHEFRWQLRQLQAIREWAVKRACDFTDGDRVVILDSLTIDSTSGWWPYREALAPGATGVVRRVNFNSHYGYWGADFVLDRQWSVGEWNGVHRHWHGRADETPEGYEPPSKYERENYPDGRKSIFTIPVRHLALADQAGGGR